MYLKKKGFVSERAKSFIFKIIFEYLQLSLKKKNAKFVYELAKVGHLLEDFQTNVRTNTRTKMSLHSMMKTSFTVGNFHPSPSNFLITVAEKRMTILTLIMIRFLK